MTFFLFQFFSRQIRPGNQHMPRSPMAEGTINPNHPPNAPQALPYPGINVSILFLVFIVMGGWLMHCFSYNSIPSFSALEINLASK